MKQKLETRNYREKFEHKEGQIEADLKKKMGKITCPKEEVSTISDLLLVTTTARNWEAEAEEGGLFNPL